MIMYENACGLTTDLASVWNWNDVIDCFGFAGSGAVDMAASGAYVMLNGLSVPSGFLSTTYAPAASFTGAPFASTFNTTFIGLPSGSSVQPRAPSGWPTRYAIAIA